LSENVRLTELITIIGCELTVCRPNVSKLMSEIKVPTNVVFGTGPPGPIMERRPLSLYIKSGPIPLPSRSVVPIPTTARPLRRPATKVNPRSNDRFILISNPPDGINVLVWPYSYCFRLRKAGLPNVVLGYKVLACTECRADNARPCRRHNDPMRPYQCKLE
jgi:hypothetical protein